MSQPPNNGLSCTALVGMITLLVIAGIAGQFVAVATIPEPVIALVDIAGVIDPNYRLNFQARFDYINDHPEVAAVVLLIDSPGGESSMSEDLYYQAVRLRERIPVVASVMHMAASGAYYAAVGSNYIMTRPGARLGSIGVVASSDEPAELNETDVTSGPFKANGASMTQFTQGLEQVKEHFAGVVYAERLIAWDKWRDGEAPFPQTQNSLATGRAWSGVEAVELGIADGFGSTTDAIALVAEMAGLRSYRTQYLDYQFMQSQGYTVSYQGEAMSPIEEVMARTADWPGYWYLYMPPVE